MIEKSFKGEGVQIAVISSLLPSLTYCRSQGDPIFVSELKGNDSGKYEMETLAENI